MSNNKLCLKCKKGYLVKESFSSEEDPLYYCNNCFKYSELNSIANNDCMSQDQDLDIYINNLIDTHIK